MFPCINLGLDVRFPHHHVEPLRLDLIRTQEGSKMPINKELTIRMNNRPGSLAKVSRAIADSVANILAFQSIPAEKTILLCMVIDNPAPTAPIMSTEAISYTA